jgi:Ca-activated chloride channel family protein
MNFHFLRPEWLIALIPVLFLLWFIIKRQLHQGSWQSLIDPKFQKVLLDEHQQQKKTYLPFTGLALIWLVTTFILAGPSWQKVEQPSEKIQQGTVILLDNSLSMLAEDIKPNRHTRARYKLIDFLKTNPHLSTGLVVYSGSAHTLSPISDDNQTILSLLPSINPVIMPKFGADALQGVTQAIRLLKQSRIKNGHLIWLLDDINETEISAIKSLIPTNIKLSLLTIGTEKGAPISVPDFGLIKDDQGKIIIAKLPTNKIEKLANTLDAQLLELQHDNSDIEQLSRHFSFNSQASNKETDSEEQDKVEKQKTIKHWLDNGVLLLLPLALVIGFSFRRGWIINSVLIWVFTLPPLVIFSPDSLAVEESKVNKADALNFFKSANQQGYEKWQQQDYLGALDKFDSPEWRGAAHYKMKDYAKAQKQFKLDKSPTGHYNQGNALAQQGQYADAQKQYEKALELKTDFKQAEQNLAIIKQIIAKQQKQKDQQEKQQKDQQQGNQTDNQQEQKDQQNQQDSSENNQSKQDKTNQKNGQNQQNKPENKSKPEQPKPEKKSPGGGKDEGKDEDKDEKTDPKEQDKEQQKLAEQEQNQTKDEKSKGKQANNAKEKSKEQSEAEQAQEAWLNQIPDDPGYFLKNKFEYQYQQRNRQQKNQKPNPPETGKIW